MKKLITVTKKQVNKFINRNIDKFNSKTEFINEINRILDDFKKDNDPLNGRINSPNQVKFYSRVKKQLEESNIIQTQ